MGLTYVEGGDCSWLGTGSWVVSGWAAGWRAYSGGLDLLLRRGCPGRARASGGSL